MNTREAVSWVIYAASVAVGAYGLHLKVGLPEALAAISAAGMSAAGLLGYGARAAGSTTVTPPPK